ncbi:histidine phosphatase family protein [Massilia pinisoli]|uniref:Histidine phosphatase family protein n=1 Tax=Massilia pinisoli TaxID=1772194 RepID=A0ABT1ZT51_9BURK|nr:histidine phosphatase family protein [Massilia pinisoli]MCS0583110.1 histidine phosphatase family protein [Massilia pinisoli]
MDLILWRHAEAEDTEPDLTRNLTDKGRQQAHNMAQWLRGYLPAQVRIVCSPANRTRQTADALGLSYDIRNDIAPGAAADDLLKATGWPRGDGVVLLVGHNPAISELATRLLAGKPFPMSLCKAGAWWLSTGTRDDERGVILKAAMVPAMLKQR